MGNSWRMRCVDVGTTEGVYTSGKVYEVKNNVFKNDKGMNYNLHLHGCYDIKCFSDWQAVSEAKWELVEDKMTTQEKIAKAEAKIAKWQGKLDALKQEKPLTGWEIPQENGIYYPILGDGEIEETRHGNFDYDFKAIKHLNSFSTEEKAQEIANIQLAYRMARKFADGWDGESDGNLWELYYNKSEKRFEYEASKYFVSIGLMFPSQNSVEAFIDQHGKEYAKLLGWELEG